MMNEQHDSTTKAIIVRQLEALPVGQRASDGFIGAVIQSALIKIKCESLPLARGALEW
jgi:hypothetical protein